MSKDLKCLSLKELREEIEKDNKEILEIPDMDNDCISRLDHNPDMLLSSLEKYIEAMGGTLTITASFPNREPVCLSLKRK